MQIIQMGFCDFCTLSADDFVPAYQRWEDHPARKEWEPLQDLGSGAFSQVVLARNMNTGALAALKVVFLDNPNLDPETELMLAQEGELLLHLSHPNLVACSQVIRSQRAHVLVLEFLRGCNVLDGIHRLSVKYTERDAWGIFHQLASAVAYLHSRGIIHRDIKPENLVYAEELSKNPIGHDKEVDVNDYPHPVVKLVDLGMALRCRSGTEEHGVLGSAGFVAPEIIKGAEHTPAMDVFSMGVMLFIMLVGRKPFQLEDSEKLRYAKMSLSDAPGLKDPRWLDLSPDAKHLLMGMLTYDPERRLTAEQVLQHEWVTTKGGRVLRLLGLDVALGAATVAEMRRLRFLCNGVVALRRVAVTVEEQAERSRQKTEFKRAKTAPEIKADGSIKEHDKYLDELKRMQKREASVHGSRNLRGVARSITAASYRHIHDNGGSVHRSNVALQAAGFSGAASNSASVHGTGMRRSGTALLLSELLVPAPDTSVRNGSFSVGKNSSGMHRSASGLQLLGASLRHYMDVSTHGGNQHRSGGGGKSGSLHGHVIPRVTPDPFPPQPSNHSDASTTTTDPSTQLGIVAPPPPPLPLSKTTSNETDDPLLKIIKVRSSFDSIEKKRHGGITPVSPPRERSTSRSGSGSQRRVHSVRPLDN